MQINKNNQNIQSFNLRIRLAKSVIKLINAQFLQSKASMFFIFVFSIIFIVLFGYLNMFGFSQNIGALFMSFIVGIITFQIIQTGCQMLPEAIVSFKQSVLLKRIGATPIRPIDFILISTCYYFFIIFLEFAWIILWVILAFGFYKFETGIPNETQLGIAFMFNGSVNWPGFILSVLYISILSIIIGIFLAAVSKSSTQLQISSSIVFFSSMLFAGNLIPMSSIDEIEALKIISLLTPLRSVNTLAYVAWNAPNPDAIFQPWNDVIFSFGSSALGGNYVIESWMMWYSWFAPIAFIAIFIFFGIKFFKWSSR